MMAAQRFPTLFDGVVAGNPGFRLSRAAIAQAWDVAAFARATPRGAGGESSLHAALSDADLRLVADAVLRRCDAADGLNDGSIAAMSACRFDPAALRCPGAAGARDAGARDAGARDAGDRGGDAGAGCLGDARIKALPRVFGGARDGQGRALYAGWPWDAGIAAPGWRAWKLGTARTPALNATLAPVALGSYFMTPPVADLDPLSLDFDRVAERTAQTASINDATSTWL